MNNNIVRLYFNHIISKSFNFSISHRKFDSKTILAMISVKRGLPLVPTMLSSLYIDGGKVTPNWARVSKSYTKELNLLYQNGGPKLLVKYLKVCSVILQQVCAGYVLPDITPLGLRVSRSKSGLPRIIPAFHRKLILAGDKKVIRFWLTQFSLYRDIHFDGELKLSTITDPYTGTSNFTEFIQFTKPFKDLFFRACDLEFSVNDNSLFQILTSGPQASRQFDHAYNSHPLTVIKSLLNFIKYPDLLTSLKYLALYMKSTDIISLISSLVGYWFERIKHINPKDDFLGRLAIKEEAAGKVRVFAMVDPLTQWVLNPLHKVLFKVLKRIPTDGTFDQLKPLEKVPYGKVPLFSFDLSSATDRLPIHLQKMILESLYGPDFAHHWGNLMVGRQYAPPVVTNNAVTGASLASVNYTVGQPMGALSSWAMLAITHHFIVQTCAWIAGVTKKGDFFSEYAVLGDDIIIWNSAVARQYLSMMSSLGVKVGLAKSIISQKGKGIEFAKKTIIDGINVSPIPYKEMSSAHMKLSMLFEFARKYGMTHLQMLRFLGYGYKVNTLKKNRVNEAIKTASRIPTSPEQLLRLFSTMDPYMDLSGGILTTAKNIRRRHLVRLIYSELNNILKKSQIMLADLVQFLTKTDVESVFNRDPQKVVLHAIVNESGRRYIKDLERLISQVKLYHYLLKDIHYFYESFMWDEPEATLTDRMKLWTPDIKSASKFIFEGQKVLDAIQCDNLINPKAKTSVTPKFLEEARTLRLWTYWAQTFISIDTSSLPTFNQRLMTKYPTSKLLS